MNDTVGIFYELSDGRIAKTYGFSDKGNTISYYFDKEQGSHSISNNKFQSWKPRLDLKDFPNASDPRLPYIFDLYYDIKYTSELKKELKNHLYEDEIKELMIEHNIVL